MTRPPRSKGCKQCLQRRVKCDGRALCCQECNRLGLQCSGPIQGVIFLDMTEKVARGKKRTRKSNQPDSFNRPGTVSVSPVATTDSHDGSPDFDPLTAGDLPQATVESQDWEPEEDSDMSVLWKSTPGAATVLEGQTPDDTFSQASSDFLPSQPTNPYRVFEHYFVGQFVQSITSEREKTYPTLPKSWLFELPNFLSAPAMPSVKYSIRAAALVFYARSNSDKQAHVDALHWYAAAVESYRETLQYSDPKNVISSPGSASDDSSESLSPYLNICVPLMLQFFEQMTTNTFDAWLSHHTAAAAIIRAKYPAQCRDGLAHKIYRSLRHFEAFQSIIQNRPCHFDTPDWETVPFTLHPKMFSDLLIDILFSFSRQLQLPPCKQGESLYDSIQAVSDLGVEAKNRVERDVLVLMSRLQDWRWCFEQSTSPAPHSTDTSSSTSTWPQNESIPEGGAMIPSPLHVYRDTFTSCCIAVYSAANIILHSILLVIAASKPSLPELERASPVARHRSAITSYSGCILRIVMHQSSTNPFCGDSMRTYDAVKVVEILATDDQQRQQARHFGSKGAYSGKAQIWLAPDSFVIAVNPTTPSDTEKVVPG